jgi:hypothetical protein
MGETQRTSAFLTVHIFLLPLLDCILQSMYTLNEPNDAVHSRITLAFEVKFFTVNYVKSIFPKTLKKAQPSETLAPNHKN